MGLQNNGDAKTLRLKGAKWNKLGKFLDRPSSRFIYGFCGLKECQISILT